MKLGSRDQLDEIESKSLSSDNQDGGSADEQDGQRIKGKKRYHRHTQRQIHEMERLVFCLSDLSHMHNHLVFKIIPHLKT